MFHTEDSAVYHERAEMHERLAASTGDVPARKMHLAMAAEYRRKALAQEAATIRVMPAVQADRLMKIDLAVQ